MKAIKPSENSNKSYGSKKDKGTTSLVADSESICPNCKSSHFIYQCPKFISSSMTPKERFKTIKRLHLCAKCLKSHSSYECNAKACSICSRPHHDLLHFGNSTTSKDIENNAKSANEKPSGSAKSSDAKKEVTKANCANESPQESCVVVGSSINKNPSQVLLATAVVKTKSLCGQEFFGRALLDSGSQSNFITDRFSRMLKLRRSSVSIPVNGISQNPVKVRHSVQLQIQSRSTSYSADMNCLILPNITGIIPRTSLVVDVNSLPPNIKLADPSFYDPGEVDLLIGAEFYFDIMQGKSSFTLQGLPPFYESKLGLVVAGRVPHSQVQISIDESNTNSFFCTIDELNAQIKRFWEIDHIHVPNHFSIEEKQCEENY